MENQMERNSENEMETGIKSLQGRGRTGIVANFAVPDSFYGFRV